MRHRPVVASNNELTGQVISLDASICLIDGVEEPLASHPIYEDKHAGGYWSAGHSVAVERIIYRKFIPKLINQII